MAARILLVEDDEMTLRLLETVLRHDGYDVFSTADGPQGIEIYRQKRPDLVLLDLALPSMNGLEVMRELKELDAHANILVVTGFASEESAEIAARYGAQAYIEKPFEIADLSEWVKAALHRIGGS